MLGKRIRITESGGKHLEPFIGTVIGVDGLGVVHVLLEDGTVLGIIQGYDNFEVFQCEDT